MRVTVNGTPRELPSRATIADAIGQLGLDPAELGVAAAVDSAVVPRVLWDDTELVDGARIEVVRAAAGG